MIRPAEPDELPGVMNVLDGAYLDVDAETVRARILAGEVLVAHEKGPILGVIVLDTETSEAYETSEAHADPVEAHIEAVAVRRRRRGDGHGTALVQAALDRFGSLSADFDADVRPFYESLGFEVAVRGDRCRGRL